MSPSTDCDPTLPAAPVDWLPSGYVLAQRYRIEGPLGAGGFGQVYRATQLTLDRQVAVKLLPNAALASADLRARFAREAALAQRLEHPNTVRLLDHGVSPEGIPFIVMELLRGESLASLLTREGPQDDARVGRVATHVLKALMEAHELGAVHRDIKPANIFITSHAGEPFFPKLLDFGIAKDLSDGAGPGSVRDGSDGAHTNARARAAALTGASHVMGTPRYMAPEQVAGHAVGAQTDVYALGLTLAEMVTGRPVFAGDDALETLMAQMSEAPVPLGDDVQRSRLFAVIQRATVKPASQRFGSAAEMLAAVEALDLDAPRAALGRGHASTRVDLTAFAPTEETPLASRRGGPPAKRWILVALGVALVALLAMAAFALFSEPRAAENDTAQGADGATEEDHSAAEAVTQAGAARATGPAVGSVLANATAVESIPGITRLSPAYPDRGFARDSRRTRAFPKLSVQSAKARLSSAGFRIESSTTTDAKMGRSSFVVLAFRGSCVATIQYFEEQSDAAASSTADSLGWDFPTATHQNRVINTAGADTSVAASRNCSNGLFDLLTK